MASVSCSIVLSSLFLKYHRNHYFELDFKSEFEKTGSGRKVFQPKGTVSALGMS